MWADIRGKIWQKGMKGCAAVTDSAPCFHFVECDRAHQLRMALLTQRGTALLPQPCTSRKNLLELERSLRQQHLP